MSLLLMTPLILAAQCGLLSAYSSGGPRSQCRSITPGHGLRAQSTDSPFSVQAGFFVQILMENLKLKLFISLAYFQLDRNNISSGASVNVELKSSGSDEFEGFFVQARDAQDNVIGAFETLGGDGKYVDCGNKVQSSVTHVRSNFKTSVKLKWNAPSDFQGKVRILATFVKDYSTYWVKVPSVDLEVVKYVEPILNDGPINNKDLGPILKELGPIMKDLKPILKDLGPILKDLGPIIKDLKPFLKTMRPHTGFVTSPKPEN